MPTDTNSARREADLRESGNRIGTLRKGRSITQDGLAKRLGDAFTSNTVSRIENGHFDMRVSSYFEIAGIFQVTPNDICPRRLLAGTPLERYEELNRKSRDILRGLIGVLITGQNDHP